MFSHRKFPYFLGGGVGDGHGLGGSTCPGICRGSGLGVGGRGVGGRGGGVGDGGCIRGSGIFIPLVGRIYLRAIQAAPVRNTLRRVLYLLLRLYLALPVRLLDQAPPKIFPESRHRIFAPG
jgi:hypothetical protein